MKIGIFGGCFNPPHKMHKLIAEYLIKNEILDKVIYVPTGNQYNKSELISDIDRYNMLKLVCDNEKIEVSNYELKKKLVYTYQTLDHFQQKYFDSQIYFVTGSDNFKQLDKWKNIEYMLNKYRFIIINRNNDDCNEIIKRYRQYQNQFLLIDFPGAGISSTLIRDELKNNKQESIIQFLNKKVLKYIEKRNLYMKEGNKIEKT